MLQKSFLSYSIFNLHKSGDSPLANPLQRVSLTIITNPNYFVKRFSQLFSVFFEKFFSNPCPNLCCSPLSQTACSFYHTEKNKSTVFRNFFRLFFGFFGKFFRSVFYHKMLYFRSFYATNAPPLYLIPQKP